MIPFDFKEAVKTYAAANSMQFVFNLFGNKSEFEKNIRTASKLAKGQNLLILSYTEDWNRAELGKLESIDYSCFIMLGRKFDADGVPASTKESHEQKYDRRLIDLKTDFNLFFQNFTCSNKLKINNHRIIEQVNMFNTNIDFVVSDNVVFTKQ